MQLSKKNWNIFKEKHKINIFYKIVSKIELTKFADVEQIKCIFKRKKIGKTPKLILLLLKRKEKVGK
jgi:hypothetical protein